MDKDKLEKIKEMLTKMIEIDEQLVSLREERKAVVKKYVDENKLDIKAVEMAVRAIKKDVDLSTVEKIAEAIEPMLKQH